MHLLPRNRKVETGTSRSGFLSVKRRKSCTVQRHHQKQQKQCEDSGDRSGESACYLTAPKSGGGAHLREEWEQVPSENSRQNSVQKAGEPEFPPCKGKLWKEGKNLKMYA